MRALVFIGDKQTISDVRAMALSEEIEASSIEDLGSELTRFQSPISFDDVNSVLTTVSLVFSTGSAALVFINKVKDTLKKKTLPPKKNGIEVRDATTNAHLGVITPDETPQNFERGLLPPDDPCD